MPAELLRSYLGHIKLLPRRLLLSTPGVQATVPMLRGVWGAALHDLDRDVYDRVFAIGEHATNRPAGYMLRPAPPDPRTAPAVDYILVGDAVHDDAVLLRGWDVASGMGLGQERRRFHIREFLALQPDGRALPAGSDHFPGRVRAEPATHWRLSQARWPLGEAPAATPCRLHFPSPLRILRDKRLVEQPTLADIVVAAHRRCTGYLPAELQEDWRKLRNPLLDLSRAAPATAWEGRRLDLHRYSARQKADLELEGVVGMLDLPSGPGDLWPLLLAGTWLHVGKGTIVGLGELHIEPLPAASSRG